jgi:hypothetical protein
MRKRRSSLQQRYERQEQRCLALQEVESLLSLKKFRSQYLRNMDYKYIFVLDGNDRRSIDVGILSRYLIEKIEVRASMYCYD